jgi:carbon storage regulator
VLVLGRKENESIHIGDEIVVKVVSIENGIVKLGIDAPKNISIVRDELIQEVTESNKAASKKVDSLDIEALSKLLGKTKK